MSMEATGSNRESIDWKPNDTATNRSGRDWTTLGCNWNLNTGSRYFQLGSNWYLDQSFGGNQLMCNTTISTSWYNDGLQNSRKENMFGQRYGATFEQIDFTQASTFLVLIKVCVLGVAMRLKRCTGTENPTQFALHSKSTL